MKKGRTLHPIPDDNPATRYGWTAHETEPCVWQPPYVTWSPKHTAAQRATHINDMWIRVSFRRSTGQWKMYSLDSKHPLFGNKRRYYDLGTCMAPYVAALLTNTPIGL